MQNLQLPTFKTEAQKLHTFSVVLMKDTKFPLIFTIVHAVWKLWAGNSKQYFKRETYFFWHILYPNGFVFQTVEILIWLDSIFEGRRKGMESIM